jgi:class 3 adenylate cyclase
MSDRADQSRSFIPRLLVNHITNRLVEGEESLNPTSFFVQGVCLLVDISGFTALSEGFCEAGKLGIDSLQVCTKGYIGQLVTIVHSYGGDIMKFAGDALVCVFTENRSQTAAETHCYDEAVVNVLIRAAMCAKAVSSMRTDTLTVHVGISCGEICIGILGGIENRWECLISGPCIHELSQCLDDAPSMQVVVTAGFTSVLTEACSSTHGERTRQNHDGLYSINLLLPSDQYKVVLEPLPSGNSRLVDVSTNWAMHRAAHGLANESVANKLWADLTERQKLIRDALIRQFVPVPIVEELEAVEDLNYVAEIREVVTMFMKVRTGT